MGASTRFCQRGTDIDRLNLVAKLLLLLVGHSIGDHESTQTAVVEVLDRIAGKDSMRNDGIDLARPMLHDRFRSLDKRSTGVGHVIDDDRNLVFHTANKHHPGDFIGARSLLVNQRKLKIKTVGNRSRSGDSVSRPVTTKEFYHLIKALNPY